MTGSVRISRAIFAHECFAEEPLTEREAWVWLIMEASWKPRKKRVGDYIVSLDRGQLAASVRFMAAAWKWTPAKVQRFLERLKKLEMISAKTDTGVTVITLCNYDDYQAPNKSSDTDAIQDRYTSDTNEKKDEIREKEGVEISPPAPPPIDQIADAFNAYNAAAERNGWQKAQKVTPARRAAMKARLAECGGSEGWRVALEKAEASDFLNGRTPHAFKCHIDFVLQQSSFTKLMEGTYDNRNHGVSGAGTPRRAGAGTIDAFAAVAQRRAARSTGH